MFVSAHCQAESGEGKGLRGGEQNDCSRTYGYSENNEEEGKRVASRESKLAVHEERTG
jgi:hypothetical protein